MIQIMVLCSLVLHPTVKKTKHNINFQYFASTDCLPLQNLKQADQHGGTTTLNTFLLFFKKNYKSHQCCSMVMKTQCYAVKPPRKWPTVTTEPQRQLQNGDDGKFPFGSHTHRVSINLSLLTSQKTIQSIASKPIKSLAYN